MTIQELQNRFLLTKKITAVDFFVLLMAVTKKEKAYLFAHPEYRLMMKEQKNIVSFFTRRMKHEPVAYIIGQKEFYGSLFFVTQDTLIPRPETELLVERVLDYIHILQEEKKSIDIFDIGTGSGNIITALAKTLSTEKENLVSLSFFAGDISSRSITIAKKNAKRNKMSTTIHFRTGNLLTPFMKRLLTTENAIIITANLPYLSGALYNDTPLDVKKFEPKTALYSAHSGLAHYYELFTQIQNMHKKVTLFLEISPEQGRVLKKNIHRFFINANIEIHKDLAKKNRIVIITVQ
ncbi:MAG: peptide chain release factor N(5)-glutamine methyltransferase [Candidatus Moranbacteria bacterium]|nr:peptide chain release factor N(5)-glutamine methyltransferase [Candidatus Moranbacteria bacterium]OIQ02680.1 MAG: protein-(glutamine-N5) methyltransferase, release factor-specific [Candidatus Moranbacteria bacterium CG2_30_41_165]PIP25240.1 MAG: protein-(glutamine-N5) methyltransferase, release factor-specific [Candidatus Moranbacteria bacterium CG23_combo_of_CG06-09_8_20_14_all_41_28]PIV86196.1 MAG: peptide chain release factor N(5)-glutamine methyltransferase [Candidatus Moranbacteria bacte